MRVEQLEERLTPTVPILNSLPGAPGVVILDFTGHNHFSYIGPAIPAWSFQGGPGVDTPAEEQVVRWVWEEIAEDFSPFNLNVTTVEDWPAGTPTTRLAMGGSGGGGWAPGALGQATWTWPDGQAVLHVGGQGAPWWAGHGSHELGHTFYHNHQSWWSLPSCTKLSEYYSGPGGVLNPIMGNPAGDRVIWWYDQEPTAGPDCEAGAVRHQDNMLFIANGAPFPVTPPGYTHVGWRPDEHGDTPATATALVPSGGQQVGFGILGRTFDKDVFSFTWPGGMADIVATPVPPPGDLINRVVGNADIRLRILDSSLGVLADLDPPGETPNDVWAGATGFLPAGTYYLEASSAGYGEQGQFLVFVQPHPEKGVGPEGAELVAAAQGKRRNSP